MQDGFLDRLLARCVDRGCWLFTGGVDGQGYPQVKAGKRVLIGHRLTYEEFIGPIPDGLTLDHLCEVKRCVNPWHMDPVPRGVNTNRFSGSNALKTHCRRNHEYTEENTYRSGGKRRCRTCTLDARHARVSGVS